MNAIIQGRVMGFLAGHYTQGLRVNVALAIHAQDSRGRMHLWEVTQAGWQGLSRDRPDIHRILMASIAGVWERLSDEQGRFRFDSVPTGDWGYLVRAYDANGFLGQHTDAMGDDGRGTRQAIRGLDLPRETKRSNVIVPVFDRWSRDHVAEPCRTDPFTDPREIIPGVREG